MTAPAKVRSNTGGAVVLQCESGNPYLGVMLTPADGGLIVALPTGPEPRHALDSVAVHLGAEQLVALRDAIDDALDVQGLAAGAPEGDVFERRVRSAAQGIRSLQFVGHADPYRLARCAVQLADLAAARGAA